MDSIVLTYLDEKSIKELYQKDFYAWINKNLELLKEKQFNQVDWDNLIEEIEDMGKSIKRAFISYLAVILEHMYKLEHLKVYSKHGEYAGKGWEKSIINAYDNIEKLLSKTPSLKHEFISNHQDMLEEAWKESFIDIRSFIIILEKEKTISIKTRNDLIQNIPNENPYSLMDLINTIKHVYDIPNMITIFEESK